MSIDNVKVIFPDGFHKIVAATLNDWAILCYKFKKFELAEQYLRRAIEINTKLSGDQSVELSTNLHSFGNLLFHKGQYNDSLDFFRRAKEMAKEALGTEKSADVARTWYQIGTVLFAKKELKKAREAYKSALQIFQAVFGSIQGGNPAIDKAKEAIKKIDRIKENEMVEKAYEEGKMSNRKSHS